MLLNIIPFNYLLEALPQSEPLVWFVRSCCLPVCLDLTLLGIGKGNGYLIFSTVVGNSVLLEIAVSEIDRAIGDLLTYEVVFRVSILANLIGICRFKIIQSVFDLIELSYSSLTCRSSRCRLPVFISSIFIGKYEPEGICRYILICKFLLCPRLNLTCSLVSILEYHFCAVNFRLGAVSVLPKILLL